MKQLVIHDATPAMADGVRPETLATRSETLLGSPFRRMDRSADAAWEWLRLTPVWPKLFTFANTPDLVWAGATQETEDIFLLGMRVGATFEVPDHFDVRRQSWTVRHVTVAVNDEGTRGAIVRDELVNGPDEANEMAMESFARRAGGAVPDVD